MDLSPDFIRINLNPKLTVTDIIQLRETSKKLNEYKILKSHNFIRKIDNNYEIHNFIKHDCDNYQLSIIISNNFEDKLFEKLIDIQKKCLIYSINFKYNEINIRKKYNIFYNFNFNLLIEIIKNNNLRYLSMDLADAWKFSKDFNENQIPKLLKNYSMLEIREKYFKNFDTIHINFSKWGIEDFYNLGIIIVNLLPFVKNIIIDNITTNIMEFDLHLVPSIDGYIDKKKFNYFLSGKINLANDFKLEELNYCNDFVINSSHLLMKAKYLDVNIYYYLGSENNTDISNYLNQPQYETLFEIPNNLHEINNYTNV